jgi:hypothetical protein
MPFITFGEFAEGYFSRLRPSANLPNDFFAIFKPWKIRRTFLTPFLTFRRFAAGLFSRQRIVFFSARRKKETWRRRDAKRPSVVATVLRAVSAFPGKASAQPLRPAERGGYNRRADGGRSCRRQRRGDAATRRRGEGRTGLQANCCSHGAARRVDVSGKGQCPTSTPRRAGRLQLRQRQMVRNSVPYRGVGIRMTEIRGQWSVSTNASPEGDTCSG